MEYTLNIKNNRGQITVNDEITPVCFMREFISVLHRNNLFLEVSYGRDDNDDFVLFATEKSYFHVYETTFNSFPDVKEVQEYVINLISDFMAWYNELPVETLSKTIFIEDKEVKEEKVYQICLYKKPTFATRYSFGFDEKDALDKFITKSDYRNNSWNSELFCVKNENNPTRYFQLALNGEEYVLIEI